MWRLSQREWKKKHLSSKNKYTGVSVKPAGFGHRDCVFLRFDIRASIKRFLYVFLETIQIFYIPLRNITSVRGLYKATVKEGMF